VFAKSLLCLGGRDYTERVCFFAHEACFWQRFKLSHFLFTVFRNVEPSSSHNFLVLRPWLPIWKAFVYTLLMIVTIPQQRALEAPHWRRSAQFRRSSIPLKATAKGPRRYHHSLLLELDLLEGWTQWPVTTEVLLETEPRVATLTLQSHKTCDSGSIILS